MRFGGFALPSLFIWAGVSALDGELGGAKPPFGAQVAVRDKVLQAAPPVLTIGTVFTTVALTNVALLAISVPTVIVASVQIAALECGQSLSYLVTSPNCQIPLSQGTTSYIQSLSLFPSCAEVTDAYGVITTGANSNGNLILGPGNYTLRFMQEESAAGRSFGIRAIPTLLSDSSPTSYQVTTAVASGTYTLPADAWGVYEIPFDNPVAFVIDNPGKAFNLTWTLLDCVYVFKNLRIRNSTSSEYTDFARVSKFPVDCISYTDPLSYLNSGQVASGRYALLPDSYKIQAAFEAFDGLPKTFAFSIDRGETSTPATTTFTSMPTSLDSLTFIGTLADRHTAIEMCAELGLYLARISSANIDYATSLLGNSPAWVNSWNGDNYQGACMALYPGPALTMIQQNPCTDLLPVICSSQFSPDP